MTATLEAKMTQFIINRATVCNCGCHGSDPWHRSTYHRVVTQISDTEGTVQMPYSTQPVRVTRDFLGIGEKSGKPIYGAWVVDRDSIVYDK